MKFTLFINQESVGSSSPQEELQRILIVAHPQRVAHAHFRTICKRRNEPHLFSGRDRQRTSDKLCDVEGIQDK